MSSKFYTGFPSSLWLKTSCAYKRVFQCNSRKKSFWGDKKRYCRLRQSRRLWLRPRWACFQISESKGKQHGAQEASWQNQKSTDNGGQFGWSRHSRRHERRLLKPLQLRSLGVGGGAPTGVPLCCHLDRFHSLLLYSPFQMGWFATNSIYSLK